MAPPALTDEFGENPAESQVQQQSKRQEDSTILNNEEDEQYNSEEDPDFDVDNPTAAAGEELNEDASGDSEAESEQEADAAGVGEHEARPRKRRKLVDEDAGGEQGGDAEEGFVMGELESGDEVTIREGKERMKKKEKTKKKKKGKKPKDGQDEDEGDGFELDDDEAGGEGGFVRTRGMKMRMQEEKRPLANAARSTVDVDALWEEMNRPASDRSKNEKKLEGIVVAAGDKDNVAGNENNSNSNSPAARAGEEMITIKRVYKFAGEVITEEKVVPKESAEAKLYLASVEKSAANAKADQQEMTSSSPRRPPRRISRFDPNPPDAIKKSWEKKTAQPDRGAPKGPKLNTVMKSRLDWATYVDREGIKDELDVHSRAKDSYLNRADFLDRTEARQEDERRNNRLRNMG